MNSIDKEVKDYIDTDTYLSVVSYVRFPILKTVKRVIGSSSYMEVSRFMIHGVNDCVWLSGRNQIDLKLRKYDFNK